MFRAEVKRKPHRHYHPRHHRRRYWPRRHYYPQISRPRRPAGMLAPIIFFGVPLVLIGVVVASFLGVQPLASIKDKVVAAIADPFVIDEEEIRTIEHEVVDSVNVIRTERGISLLVWDDTLYGYSKSHSEDMAKQGQLFHTPVGMSYGENIWWGSGEP